MELIKEVHNTQKFSEFSDENYKNFNFLMVAELKELGITVKDEFVVNLASIIENDLLSEEEQNNESPKEIIVEKQEEKQIVNPFIEIAKN